MSETGLDPTVIGRQSVDPTAAIDAVFVGADVDFEIIQQIDGQAPKNLVLALQLISGEFILSGENTSFQCHDYLYPSDCRVEPLNQAIMKLSRETAVATEAVCEDDKPKARKLGAEHEVLIGCHNVISFIFDVDRPLPGKEGSRTADRGLQAGEPILSLAEKLGETAPSLTPDLDLPCPRQRRTRS
ncbi:hypothetical protein pRL100317 (plasmid) [Rhizobium johnstonii 3841]|uniref:Uncharacterized protein n=1 Tax=Rhizobium johnstonii (strain DSM 114642 / LMG 32736 / 3841) TaxID=216596 RepID=Q1M7I9_RHIJ3|nr:hypothetical protein pRL100317 [Rhizobium johnstonii 3841]